MYKEACGQNYAPAALPPRKDQIHILQEAGWAPWPVWTARKISVQPGFDHPTVHHVTSPCNHYAIPPATTLQYTTVTYIALYYTLLCSIKVYYAVLYIALYYTLLNYPTLKTTLQ